MTKRKNITAIIKETTGITDEILLVVTGLLLFYFNYSDMHNSLIKNVVVTAFVLALFDFVLKKIILFHVDNDYYKFIANNIITIVMINFLVFFIRQDYEEINYYFFLNLAIASLFYETIVYKLYNFNNICNNKLRSSTKIIVRLATIHILSNFLNEKSYSKEWFDLSLSQLFNFLLFDGLFNENFFENDDV